MLWVHPDDVPEMGLLTSKGSGGPLPFLGAKQNWSHLYKSGCSEQKKHHYITGSNLASGMIFWDVFSPPGCAMVGINWNVGSLRTTG